MMRGTCQSAVRGIAFFLLLLLSPFAHALDGVLISAEYEKLLSARTSLTTLGPDLFGDDVNLYDGSLRFRQIDVSVPGNNSLEVSFGRTFVPRQWEKLSQVFADWDLDIPHLEGTFVGGWATQNSPNTAICTKFSAPPTRTGPQGGSFAASEYWGGNFLVLPGKVGGGEILKRSAGMPYPTDGYEYPLATRDGVVFRCLVNGTTERFEAVTPDGTRYKFDVMASRSVKRIEKANPNADFFSAQSQPKTGGASLLAATNYYALRQEVWILPSLVTDKFGNTVTYTWDSADPWKLLSIVASDGRSISVSYVSGTRRVASVTTASASATRTWSYVYQALPGSLYRLSNVIQPDGSQWTFDLQQLRYVMHDSMGNSNCDYPGDYGTPTGTGTMTHPSGASGSFTVAETMHGRSHVPRSCIPDPWGYALNPRTYKMASLTSKSISGPGIGTLAWTYAYTSDNSCWSTGGTPTCNGSSPTTKWVDVTAPDSTVTRYTFGNRWRINEGQLLQVDEGFNGSTALRTTVNTYAPLNTGPYPSPVGTSLQPRNDGYMTSRHAPLQSRVIYQQGQSFAWQVQNTCPNVNGSVYCFDVFARPTRIYRAGGVRYETTTYHDNQAKWVLGQVAQTTINGVVSAAATYDATYAVQLTFDVFGKRQQTLTWDTSSSAASGQLGTIYTAKDGNNNTTTFSSWKRGIPQLIQYADGSSESAVVDDYGLISSTTDENLYTTSYTYDSMGRLASTTYPAGGPTAWNPTYQTFEQVPYAEYGIAGGHWRHTTTTGNGVKLKFYDAMWRPLLTREYDAANVAGTQRFQRFTYDHGGRTTFASYPGSTDSLTTGHWSSYDALGRVTTQYQSSEYGNLPTYTEYLSGFQTRVTDPKSNQTITSYLAFDSPTTEWPTLIAHPEGAYTHIFRDIYGKPTQIRRSDSSNPNGGSVATSRHYVYSGYQTLCKTIEPETGATVQDFDGAGNLSWSASGLYLPSTSDCNFSEGYYSGRAAIRSYDARNRLSTLSFPDGRGNQTWGYTPDGLPSSIITNNANGGEQVINGYSYNNRRFLAGESVAYAGWYNWSFGYGFDANGKLYVQTYPTGLAVYHHPNALGQATHISDGGYVYATGISYYPNGAVSSFTYGNGVVHSMQQNARQLPARSTDGSIVDLGYTYDLNGNVTLAMDYVDGVQSRGMNYDGLDRLIQVTSNMFGTANYAYDVLDNLARVTVGASSNFPARDFGYCYDGAWRLTSIRTTNCWGAEQIGLSYDAQGNLASKAGQQFDFDFGNRLRNGASEYHRYDGYGRRVNRYHSGSFSLHQYSQAGQLMFTQDVAGNRNIEHIYLGTSLVAVRQSTVDGFGTHVRYQHTDALGSPIAATDASQGIFERTGYEPFGAQVLRPLTDGVGFAGHVQDAATGLTYMQQRYYDPLIGRFLSTDPVTAYDGGTQFFNRYAYAFNNPYRFTDPDGRAPGGCGDGSCDRSSEERKPDELPEKEFVKGQDAIEQSGIDDLIGQLAAAALKGANCSTEDCQLAAAMVIGVVAPKAAGKLGKGFPNRQLPRDRHGNPVPDPEASGSPHSQLGTQEGRRGTYPQAREFDAEGRPVRDIDFTDHGRGHPSPHQHPYVPNSTGGTPQRGPHEPL